MFNVKYWTRDEDTEALEKYLPADADELKKFINYLYENHICIESEELFLEIKGYNYPNFCFYPNDRAGSFGNDVEIHFDLLVPEYDS